MKTSSSFRLVTLSQKPLLLAALFALTVPAKAAGVYVGESECVPGHDIFQYWYVVDPANAKKLLGGTIASIKRNDSVICNDHDWNIYVTPNSSSAALLKNSEGNKNSNDRIEVEIRGRPDNVDQHFPVGTEVEAWGWWVEDWGHDGKTEIHPVTWMRGTDPDKFSIWMTRDRSNRFVHDLELGPVGRIWTFEMGMPAQSIELNPASGPVPTSSGQGVVYKETSRADRWGMNAHNWASSGSSAAYTFGHTPPQIWLDVTIGKGSHSTVVTTDTLEPYYLGRFERSVKPLFSETLSLSLVNEPNSWRQYLRATVKMKLDAGAGNSLVNSSWDHNYSDAAGNFSHATTALNTPGNPQELTIAAEYVPNFPRVWKVEALASDRAPTFNVAARSAGDTPDAAGDLPAKVRTFYGATREYYFRPTSLGIAPQYPECKRATLPKTCPCSIDLLQSYQLAYPGISLRNVKATATFTRKGDGTPIPAPTPQEIGFGSTVVGDSVSVQRDAGGSITVNFDVLPGGNDLYPLGNYAEVIVNVHSETTLGETFDTAYMAAQPSCQAPDFPKIKDIGRVPRIMVLIELFERLNIPFDVKHPPQPGDPPWKKIEEAWPKSVKGLNAPYKTYRRVKPELQKVLEAVFRVVEGKKKPSAEDAAVMNVLNDIASRLGPVQRSLPPRATTRDLKY